MSTKSQALKVHRTRLRNRGMKRVEVCIPGNEAPVIRKVAAILRTQAREAAELREILGLTSGRGQTGSAADLFAMPEPLPEGAELLWNEAMRQIEQERKASRLNRPRKVAL